MQTDTRTPAKPFYSGFVAILGRPNVGKSTLMNALVGYKVAIVSPKAQTTRNRITGVLTGEDFQAVFMDTPGIHTPRTKLGETMMKSVGSALEDIEALLFVVDASDFRPKDRELIEQYSSVKAARLLVVNKIDAVSREQLAALLAELADIAFDEILPISALKADGTELVTAAIRKYLPEGPMYFPEDYVTDRQERFIIAETVREKALACLREEIPHGIGVDVMKISTSRSGVTHIDATIYCERDSHKNIIIGKHGSMIGRIGALARQDMEKMLGSQVNLQLWVKVVPDWRNRPSELKELGYADE